MIGVNWGFLYGTIYTVREDIRRREMGMIDEKWICGAVGDAEWGSRARQVMWWTGEDTGTHLIKRTNLDYNCKWVQIWSSPSYCVRQTGPPDIISGVIRISTWPTKTINRQVVVPSIWHDFMMCRKQYSIFNTTSITSPKGSTLL